LSPERKRMYELKVLAEELFKGKKSSYEATFPNYFMDIRMATELQAKIPTIQTSLKNTGETFVYATSCTKLDRHGYKEREGRIFVISNKSLYLYESKELKLKLSLSSNELPGVAVTNLNDLLLVLRIPAEKKKLKGDLLIWCPNVIEVVTRLVQQCNRNTSLLKIEPPGEIRHHLDGGSKTGTIQLQKSTNGLPLFQKKSGNLLVVQGA